jgi:hypothetical protein
MAPLVHNATDRYWVDYEGPAGKHSIMFRFPSAAVESAAITTIRAIITAMRIFQPTTATFIGLRKSEALTVVSFPKAWDPIVGLNSGTFTANMYPQFISWVGRDSNGIRVRYTLQGCPFVPDTDYRLPRPSSADVDAVLDAFDAATEKPVTAGALVPVMNNYANTGFNAYFQRKRRKTA